ncbi:hypothetical protein [Pseudomonas sp.]|uniref:hypothetical protein n=1 Tax=Pseudomonas sp. TaxID=306 RepID=UPI003BB63088
MPELYSANRQVSATLRVSVMKQAVYQACASIPQAIEIESYFKSGTAFALSFTTLTKGSPLKKELQPWGISKKV